MLREPLPWESAQPRFSAVSAMGFGGINTHVVLEEADPARPAGSIQELRMFAASPQDTELFVFGAEDGAALIARLSAFIEIARDLSLGEMADAAAALHNSAAGAIRAAVVASSPSQLLDKLLALRELIQSGVRGQIQPSKGIYISSASRAPRIGLLFPGQAAPVRRTAGGLGRRFAACERLYADGSIPDGPDTDTSLAQPTVVRASLSALSSLEALGITGTLAIGHSLGEIVALTWAGALDWDAAVRLASLRGRAMMSHSCAGAMASIAASWENVESLLASGVVIAAVNGPRQTVVSGDPQAISAIATAARARGWHVSMLPVAHAFHSPAMVEVARALAPSLAAEPFRVLERPVYSTVTGASVARNANLPELLTRQITSRVEFETAIKAAVPEADLFVEAGPGTTLAGLAAQCVDTPAVSLDAGSESYRGLLSVAAAAFVLGAPVRFAALFEGRFTKPFAMIRPKFLANPCESAPIMRTATTNNRKPQHAPEPAPLMIAHNGRPRPGRPGCPTPCALDATTASPFETVRNLIARHAELPATAIGRDHRLLSDLHLNSIAVAQIVPQAARALGVSAPLSLAGLANATVSSLAETLVESRSAAREQRRGQAQCGDKSPLPPGLDSWVRCFAMHWVEEESPVHARVPGGESNWRIVAPADSTLKAAVLRAFSKPGSGVVVYVPAGGGDSHAGLLLEAARQLRPEGDRFILLHHGDGSSAFARSLRMERPKVDVCVIRIPAFAAACEKAYLEAVSARGFEEVWYDDAGQRRVPQLRHVAIPDSSQPYLTERDVLLVSGGGKGIGAECAIALARSSSARLMILGRSDPEADHELALNLDRMSAAGVRFYYVRADICDCSALTDALWQGEQALGKVTAILHAAGRNAPALIDSLNAEAIAATVAPKVDGLRNLLAAVSPESLRLLVSFGSIIGRMGLAGNADYALANERLRQITEDYGARHPQCRCLTLEWSLWSGAGMAERLGAVASLAQQGMAPISPEQGTSVLASILGQAELPPSLIVASRFQALPELRFEHPEPPLSRFLERTQLFIPGVELIADAKVSHSSDPYLNDHVFERTPLLPAVIGMEAMAQAAKAVSGETGVMIWRDVAFERPIIVPPGESAAIRVYALAELDGTVQVALRAEQSGFEADCFRARIRFEAAPTLAPIPNLPQNAPAPIDLYGTVLFQSGRFQRLLGYTHLTGTSCSAKLKGAVHDRERWFGLYYPPVLRLGDPGLRDAAIHSIQGCIPDRTLIPERVDEIRMFATLNGAELTVQAVERSSCWATFVYDLDLLDSSGRMIEQWRGLTLRAVASRAAASVTTVAR